MVELLTSASVEGYEGITDDAGNKNRVEIMLDAIAGKGLVPYFEESEKIRAFFDFAGGDSFSLDDLDEMMEVKAEYEDETGKLFYIIAAL